MGQPGVHVLYSVPDTCSVYIKKGKCKNSTGEIYTRQKKRFGKKNAN